MEGYWDGEEVGAYTGRDRKMGLLGRGEPRWDLISVSPYLKDVT